MKHLKNEHSLTYTNMERTSKTVLRKKRNNQTNQSNKQIYTIIHTILYPLRLINLRSFHENNTRVANMYKIS